METDICFEVDQVSLTKKDLVKVYDEFSPRLFAYGYRLLGDSQLAEDCVSETFSRLLRAIHGGSGPNDNLKAYLYRIAHNWIMDHYRKQGPETVEIDSEQMESNVDNPEGKMTQAWEQERVRKALLNLPENQRQVIMLRFYDNWTHAEAASALGKSEEATRALQHRALDALRKMLVPAQGKGNR